MILVVSSRLLDLLTLRNKRVSAMSLWPFVILRHQEDTKDLAMLNHESIHHRQQLELLIIPYYIWYFLEYWTYMFLNQFNHHKSYMSISFEREAYAYQTDLNYLKHRRWLASWPFFKTKFKK